MIAQLAEWWPPCVGVAAGLLLGYLLSDAPLDTETHE